MSPKRSADEAYIPMRMAKQEALTGNGLPVTLPADVLGVIFVYRTKTAMEKATRRGIDFQKITIGEKG